MTVPAAPPPAPSFSSSSFYPAPAASGRPRTHAEVRYAANLRLVPYCLARLVFLTPQQREEASTAGMMGLWLAAQNFDPARGVKFVTYAYDCVRGSLLRHLKVERRQKRLDTVSLDLPLGDGGGELADMVADPNAEKPGAAAVSEAGFEARIANLTERQQALLRLVYQGDMGFGEVGEAWGISRARVHQIHIQALKELKLLDGRKGIRTSRGGLLTS